MGIESFTSLQEEWKRGRRIKKKPSGGLGGSKKEKPKRREDFLLNFLLFLLVQPKTRHRVYQKGL